MSLIKKYLILFTFSVFLISCAKDKEKDNDILKKNEEWLPRMDDRIEKAASEGKGILGKKGVFGDKNESGGGSIKFASTNIMWKASLKTLEAIPLVNVDYAGGIIVTDWYGGSNNTKDSSEDKFEEIKITVKFVGDEIKSTSIEIITHKKVCLNNKCSTSLGGKKLNDQIKEKIIENTRYLSIAEAKKK